jgi:parvulin-like peptidyl-prolyl isomerase
MMQTLRKYMKHVMWIVAVTFIGTIIFSWGMGGFKNRGEEMESGVVGSINGEKIMYQQFTQLLEDEYKRVREQEKSDGLSEYRRSTIRDQVWQQLVREKLLAQEVKKQKIVATPEEVVYSMRSYPPDFVRSAEYFQTNGKFDMNKYREALSDERNLQAWIQVENYFKAVIPIQKLQQNVIATVRVSDAALKEEYRLQNEKVNVKYAFFDPAKTPLQNPRITDSDVKKYYKEHLKDYKEPEQRKIQYVLYEIKPTSEDSAQTRSECMDLLNQIKAGEDFAKLAKENSEDNASAEKGGDIGFIGKNAMVKPFEDAAFAAKIGETVGPVVTPYGLHILQVTARKREKSETQVQVRHILLTFKTSQQSQESVNNRAEFFAEEVQKTKGKGFKEIAQQENLTVKETPLFRRGGFISGIGLSPRANYLAFREKKGWVSQAVNADPNILVFQILSIQKERVKPLEDVKASIQSVLMTERKKEAALNAAKTFCDKLRNPEDFETLAKRDSLQVQETGFFSAQGYIPQVGRDVKFSAAAFKLKPGEISRAVEGTRGAYVLLSTEMVEADPRIFESDKTSFRQTSLQKKQNQMYQAWFRNLMDNAKIKDYRDMYF